MFSIRETKSGGTAIIFGKEYAEVAKAIFPKLAEIIFNEEHAGTYIDEQNTKTLAGVRESVEGRRGRLEELVKISPPRIRVENLPVEINADEVCSIIGKKIKERHGKELPVHYVKFYKDLERDTGHELSRIHRMRTEGRDTRIYPNRKIDSILTVLSPEYVRQYAVKYTYR